LYQLLIAQPTKTVYCEIISVEHKKDLLLFKLCICAVVQYAVLKANVKLTLVMKFHTPTPPDD